MEIPKKLYHVTTTRDAAVSIYLNGFNTDLTYFCETIDHAIEFFYRIHGDIEYQSIEVDVSKLDIEKLEESTDHNPRFFSKGLKAYVYEGKVPKEAITEIYKTTITKK